MDSVIFNNSQFSKNMSIILKPWAYRYLNVTNWSCLSCCSYICNASSAAEYTCLIYRTDNILNGLIICVATFMRANGYWCCNFYKFSIYIRMPIHNVGINQDLFNWVRIIGLKGFPWYCQWVKWKYAACFKPSFDIRFNIFCYAIASKPVKLALHVTVPGYWFILLCEADL